MFDSVEQIRKSFGEADTIRDKGLLAPCDIMRTCDISYGKYGKWNLLDVYSPSRLDTEGKTIVCIHGGGWVYGDKERYQYYAMSLAQQGFHVVNFSYRLAPENVYPCALEDINQVLIWCKEEGKKYGIDCSRLFVVGDSAGAQLASQYMTMLTNRTYRNMFDMGLPDIEIKAAALNCGVYDLKKLYLEKEEPFRSYIGEVKDEKQLDVLDYITDAFPASYIMTSNGDFLRENSCDFYKLLKSRKVRTVFCEYGGEDVKQHVFHLNVRDQAAQECNRAECVFFHDTLSCADNGGQEK